MQIGGKVIKNILVNMGFYKNISKRHMDENRPFHASLLGNGLNQCFLFRQNLAFF
jgi:hypothetical protein